MTGTWPKKIHHGPLRFRSESGRMTLRKSVNQ